MGQDADQLKQDIQMRRQHMSRTVDAIEDRVTPGRVVERQQARLRQSWGSLRDNVMGSRDYDDRPFDERRGYQIGYRDLADSGMADTGMAADDPHATGAPDQGSVRETAHSLAGSAGAAMSAAGDAPQAVARQTKGNPLIAGAIAFGIGALVGSVAPTTDPERRAVKAVEPQLRTAAQELKQGAAEAAGEVRASAQEHAGELRESAKESVETVKGHAQESAQDVQDHAASEASGSEGGGARPL